MLPLHTQIKLNQYIHTCSKAQLRPSSYLVRSRNFGRPSMFDLHQDVVNSKKGRAAEKDSLAQKSSGRVEHFQSDTDPGSSLPPVPRR